MCLYLNLFIEYCSGFQGYRGKEMEMFAFLIGGTENKWKDFLKKEIIDIGKCYDEDYTSDVMQDKVTRGHLSWVVRKGPSEKTAFKSRQKQLRRKRSGTGTVRNILERKNSCWQDPKTGTGWYILGTERRRCILTTLSKRKQKQITQDSVSQGEDLGFSYQYSSHYYWKALKDF